MSVFCFKKIHHSNNKLFDLKKLREEKGMSLSELENITHIPKKYLLAIEEHQTKNLPPAKAYRLAYIRGYAKALDINFEQLKQILDEKLVHKKCVFEKIQSPSNFSFYFLWRNLGLVAIILAFCGYIAWQVKGIIEPPKLSIFNPVEGFVSALPSLPIQGETAKETRLTINGQDIMINEQGIFKSNIDLFKGVNTITITAINKHGKSTTEVRHVIRQENTNKP